MAREQTQASSLSPTNKLLDLPLLHHSKARVPGNDVFVRLALHDHLGDSVLQLLLVLQVRNVSVADEVALLCRRTSALRFALRTFW